MGIKRKSEEIRHPEAEKCQLSRSIGFTTFRMPPTVLYSVPNEVEQDEEPEYFRDPLKRAEEDYLCFRASL